MNSKPLHALAAEIASQRIAAARRDRAELTPDESRARLRADWARLLGDVAPQDDPRIIGQPLPAQALGPVNVERIHLCTEPGIVVPVLLFLPPRSEHERLPVVVGVAQHGKQMFLQQRAEGIAELILAGVAVCLPDVRGTGETSPGEERDRRSAAASLSSSELMLGQSLLGGRLRDVRSVCSYLRTRTELDQQRMAMWGDSFAPVNAADANFQVPHTATNRPTSPEPLGGLVALLAALYNDDVQAVYIRGGLSDFHSVLAEPFCYLPHDAVVPGVLAGGDLCDAAAALAPRALWLDGLVDGFNRGLPEQQLVRRYETARAAYASAKAPQQIRISDKPAEGDSAARWLISKLQATPPSARGLE